MKFKIKPKIYPNHRQTRIVTRFLWRPHRDGYTIRWLEFAKVKQIYYHYAPPENGWKDLEFVG